VDAVTVATRLGRFAIYFATVVVPATALGVLIAFVGR